MDKKIHDIAVHSNHNKKLVNNNKNTGKKYYIDIF